MGCVAVVRGPQSMLVAREYLVEQVRHALEVEVAKLTSSPRLAERHGLVKELVGCRPMLRVAAAALRQRALRLSKAADKKLYPLP